MHLTQMYRCIKQPTPVLHRDDDIRAYSERIHVVHQPLIPDYQPTLNELFKFFPSDIKFHIFSTPP